MIYPQLLKADFEKLPPALQDFHASAGEHWANGTAAIRHERPWLARLVGFPAAGDDIPVRLHVLADEDQEIWTRWFGNSMRRSVQRAVGGLFVEKLGPLRIHFRVSASEAGIEFESCAARLWGIPFPIRMEAWERGHGSSWEFKVTVTHIGSYRGVVAPAS